MRSLDWTNERYVRAYTRDTPSWILLGYEVQSLYLQLLRKMDRAGVITLDDQVAAAVSVAAMFNGADVERVGAHLEKLVSGRWLIYRRTLEGHWLLDPEFMEREEATRSNAQRLRESRARRRERAAAKDHESDKTQNESPPTQDVAKPTLRAVPSVPKKKKKKAPTEPAAARPLSAQQLKVKEVEDFYKARELKPPPASTIAKWLKTAGSPARLQAFLEDMEGAGHLGNSSYCWKVLPNWNQAKPAARSSNLGRLSPEMAKKAEELGI